MALKVILSDMGYRWDVQNRRTCLPPPRPPWMLGAPFDSSEDACERNAAAAAKYAWPFANCKLILSALDAASWRACFAWGVGKTKKNTHICRGRRSLARLFLTNKFLITQKSLLNKIHTYNNIQTKTHRNKESVASIETTIVDSHFGSSVSFQHIVDTLQQARREAWLARCLILSPPQWSSWRQGSLLRN